MSEPWFYLKDAVHILRGNGTIEHADACEMAFAYIEAANAEIERLRDALGEAREVLSDHHDIEDGGAEGEYPYQRPNWAMRATNEIDEVLAHRNPRTTLLSKAGGE